MEGAGEFVSSLGAASMAGEFVLLVCAISEVGGAGLVGAGEFVLSVSGSGLIGC